MKPPCKTCAPRWNKPLIVALCACGVIFGLVYFSQFMAAKKTGNELDVNDAQTIVVDTTRAIEESIFTPNVLTYQPNTLELMWLNVIDKKLGEYIETAYKKSGSHKIFPKNQALKELKTATEAAMSIFSLVNIFNGQSIQYVRKNKSLTSPEILARFGDLCGKTKELISLGKKN